MLVMNEKPLNSEAILNTFENSLQSIKNLKKKQKMCLKKSVFEILQLLKQKMCSFEESLINHNNMFAGDEKLLKPIANRLYWTFT